VYNDKQAALERFKANYQEKLSEAVKRRLVLENDEVLVYYYQSFANQAIDVASQMCYNIDDLLTVCPDLDIPIVVDYHHDWIKVR
jgi:UV DNA damage endonuclease